MLQKMSLSTSFRNMSKIHVNKSVALDTLKKSDSLSFNNINDPNDVIEVRTRGINFTDKKKENVVT